MSFISVNLQAQVGINYTPTGTENADLIIKKSINKPALRIETNQAISKDFVLFSDSYGNVAWRAYGLINVPAKSGVYGTGLTSLIRSNSPNPSNAMYTNASITLPPGKWAVNLAFNLDIKVVSRTNSSNPWIERNLDINQSIWARMVISDTQSSNQNYNTAATGDRVISNLYLASGVLQGPTSSGILKGEIYIHNSGLVDKTYYLKISLQSSNITFNNNNGIRLKNFALGPSFETNAVDRFYAVYAGE